jgi:hypothetical protein
MLAVRWYLRFGLSYRDLEELLAERGIDVDHVTLFRWVQRFTPLLIDAARPCRHVVGRCWFVDETYVKGHCCVVRSCARRHDLGVRSDRRGQLVECSGDAELTAHRVGAEFVVPSAEVLHERMTADDDAGGAVGLQPAHRS